MVQPYIGEIRMFAGNFAPAGWELCEGQLLPIVGNETLYQLIGTRYGGDGESTFGLPDIRRRVPIHPGNGFDLGIAGGVEEVTLTTSQIPNHTHHLVVNGGQGSTPSPSNQVVLAGSPNVDLYISDTTGQTLGPSSVSPAGGSQPHSNMQPYLCVNFIISRFGIFPTPS